ncbi:FtsX-like permease family protein [Specibacter cremeus]|uniref:FtsX-like permease family protein n=1 Tax=Specibacter cremeus TaxID=1629051 RepID=UPI000F7736E0|nr:FtsX-like permease family protein [Specibacter cremeus]
MALDLTPVPGGRRHRRALALKMAWRDIRRHKGRSVLIMTLIMLPVAGLSAAATAGQSMLATPQETVLHQLGQTQGRLSNFGAVNAKTVQAVKGDLGYPYSMGDQDKNFVAAHPADVVPAGYRAITSQALQLTSPVGNAQVPLQGSVTDVLDPAFEGKYRLLDGAAPTAATQALGTPGLFTRFGLALGDTLTTSAGTFEMVGKVRDAGLSDGNTILYLEKSQVSASLAGDMDTGTVYLVGDKPITWTQAKEFNAKGVQVTSRSLLLNPPPRAEVGAQDNGSLGDYRRQTMLSYALVGALVGVLALLEVGLLAGAAFAVGARKQQRDLALLAASGAEGGTIRSVVTASGVWLGFAGGVAGALLGTVAATVAVLVVRSGGHTVFSGLHVQWPAVVLLVAVGLAAGWLAAVVPARAVARQATIAALKSGRSVAAPSKWTTRIGLGLLLLAALVMAAGGAVALATRGTDAFNQWMPLVGGLIIGGAVLLVVGLIFLTGRIIAVLTARTSWLPVPLRLAARDAARNRGRTVPAVASVLAAAMLAGALMVGSASINQQSSDDYQWSYNLNQTALPLQYVEYPPQTQAGPGAVAMKDPKRVTVDPVLAIKTLTQELGTGTQTMVLRGVQRANDCYVGYENTAPAKMPPCIDWVLREPAQNRCELAADSRPVDLGDWRCKGSMSNTHYGGGLPPIVAGGEAELTALLGHAPSPAALATLNSGGMVVTNRVYLADDNTATVMSYDSHDEANYSSMTPQQGGIRYSRPTYKAVSTHTLAATVDAPDKALGFYGVVSPETAATLKLPVADRYLLVNTSGPLSAAEKDRVTAALAQHFGGYGYVSPEQGPSTPIGLILWLTVVGGALITLSAAGITAGLALADGRGDHATLASVGADPRLRKALSGAQTLMTALLGTVLGLFAGAVPVVVVLSLQRGMPIVLPWLQLGALLILVPLVGAAAAWLLTRARLPMTRRQTLA